MAKDENEWQSAEFAPAYVERGEQIPQRVSGETALLDEIPPSVGRVLDLGSGNGRLLKLVLSARPGLSGVALDFSPPLLEQLNSQFGATPNVEVVDHNLEIPLPQLGVFDLVVSGFAIHHLTHERKRELYEEIWTVIEPGGIFCNLEHVASVSPAAHERFLQAIGISAAEEDRSNKLLDVQTQLGWLSEIGFVDVDCNWKWRELALLVGRKPARSAI